MAGVGVATPSAASANEELAGAGGGAVGKPPEARGGGAQALFLEPDRLREGGVGVQLQVGDGNPRGPRVQSPGRCF